MADKNVQTVVAEEVNPAVVKAKDFWTKFSKPIIYVGSAIILLGGAWLAYKNFVIAPKQQKANETIFAAETLFGKMVQAGTYTKDTVNTILNGGADGENKVVGLLTIIKNYSGSNAANLAQYMAGASYLHIGEFDKAIKHLKEFDGNGASQVQSDAYRMLGDAYAEKKNNSDAMSYYQKAVAAASSKDDRTLFLSLSRAAEFCEATGKNDEAIKYLKQIKEQITPSFFQQNRIEFDADKYLAKLGVFE
jgi:tetratricopeptide (TPR) repeat protein